MSSLAAKEPINMVIYLLLLGSSIFVNKYVLSVLNFLYPTIFQGWQTLIGGILLKILLSNRCLSESSTALDKAGFVSLLPSFLFFTAGIVASSKALAGLSIAIYLCLQNTSNAFLYLLELAPTFRGGAGPLALAASIFTMLSASLAVLFDIDMTISDSPYFWMFVYLACFVVHSLHLKIADARYNEVDRLYFSYVFSVVVLAPASLYLEEAFDVLRFPHASRYDFYAGCLLSGIVGLFLNLVTSKVRYLSSFSFVDAFGRMMMSCLSLLAFADSNSTLVKAFIFLNLVSAIFVPVPKAKDPEMHQEAVEPLLIEEKQ